jgi:hypothetical protein
LDRSRRSRLGQPRRQRARARRRPHADARPLERRLRPRGRARERRGATHRHGRDWADAIGSSARRPNVHRITLQRPTSLSSGRSPSTRIS